MYLLRRPISVVLVIAVAGLLVCMGANFPWSDRGSPLDIPVTSSLQTLPTPEVIVAPHLEWAEKECIHVLEEHLRVVEDLFIQARANTRHFADEALGMSSKWKLITDSVPFTKGDRHQRFLRSKFEQHFFSSVELEQTVQQAVSDYLRQIDSIEGEMLVRIRIDAEDFPQAFPVFQGTEAEILSRYEEAFGQIVTTTGSRLQADIRNDLVSLIAGEVLIQVAARMGISAGILGTGAASSWATLGMGVVVSLIVDQMVSWIWDWYADPRGNLAEELNRKLGEIQASLLEGDDGLRAKLRQLAQERVEVRKRAIQSLFQYQQ